MGSKARSQHWSCGQNNFASEDERLWTEGRKIIAFGFFLFHCWKSTNPAGAILVFKTCITERIYTKSETFINEQKLLTTEAKTNIITISVVNFRR